MSYFVVSQIEIQMLKIHQFGEAYERIYIMNIVVALKDNF